MAAKKGSTPKGKVGGVNSGFPFPKTPKAGGQSTPGAKAQGAGGSLIVIKPQPKAKGKAKK
jgi:hypothetical protein